ncbi:hydrolase [Lachnospiraceae bacterium NSJ-143]|nr:hydrolase [Lachnospiraceae bacterium NSJ-143]
MNEVYIEIINSNDSNLYIPVAAGEISIESYRSSMPSKAVFNILKDEEINVGEGSEVRIYVDSNPLFKGYVFTKKRDKDGIIAITAYDQLRYLKNKGTYNFSGYTLSDVIRQIAMDYKIQCRDIENSGFILSDFIKDDKTLIDIIQDAIDITYENTGVLYVLFDDFGGLSLKRAEKMIAEYLAEDATAENFSYQSTIDSGTYNQIRLTLKGKKGIIQEYFKNDSSSIAKWGVLQYTGNIDDGEDGNAKADKLLGIHNSIQRKLSVSGAFGDLKVRAGSVIYVRTNKTGDIELDEKMTVESCRHRFKGGVHTMDLSLKGGLINSV